MRDGALTRLIGKWLNAGVLEDGVLEDGSLSRPSSGTPQGGVTSPLLANVFLHAVLDVWFETQVKPRMHGRAFLVRYCDDFVPVFSRRDDAERVYDVLPKRFARFGLTLHPEKPKLLDFTRPGASKRPQHFDFLGFTHLWARSRHGSWVVKQQTAARRPWSWWHRLCADDPLPPVHAVHSVLRPAQRSRTTRSRMRSSRRSGSVGSRGR